MRRRLDGEWWAVAAGVALAGAGWAVQATLLALAGTLTALVAVTSWVWQRHCLTGVTYRRQLGQERALFGEEVTFEVELVNDKPLPLTWLHVEDDVPRELTIRGGTVVAGRSDFRRQLEHVLPMLPYQRVRRRLTVVCDRRGEHTFGPARLHSGDPVGYHQRWEPVPEEHRLLVYPKIFRLASPAVASRVPLGAQRAAPDLPGDPSRVAGVREYQPGDPLRHVDWRATARSPSLLVRVFEPTAALRVAVFADPQVPELGGPGRGDDLMELTLALTASVVAHHADLGVPTGLYSSATVRGRPIAREPSSAPTALAIMLELLARASPYGQSTFPELLLSEGGRLRRGASLVVVAADFPEPTLVALSSLRRRLHVTALWVGNEEGNAPPAALVDTRWEVTWTDDWATRSLVELGR